MNCAPTDVNIDPVVLQRVIAYLDGEFAAGSFPGAALVATRHRETFIEQYWGSYCNAKGEELPFDGSVINMLYSGSKGISSTVVMMAWQDGLIDLDVPLSTYIPGFTGGGKDGITIRHLLTHSAGMPTSPFGSLATDELWEQAVQACCAAAVEWEPGSRTSYHAATGMFLAAEAVRRVTPGYPQWGEICRQRLFEALGATSFSFEIPSPTLPVAWTPWPKSIPAPITTETFNPFRRPGGGCMGRIEDLLKLLHLHLNKGEWEGRTLLEPRGGKRCIRSSTPGRLRRRRRRGGRACMSFGGWAGCCVVKRMATSGLAWARYLRHKLLDMRASTR